MIPIILVWRHSFPVLYMPKHVSMLRRCWISLVVKFCPFTMVTICETILQLSKNWIIFVSSDILTIVKSLCRFFFRSCLIILNVCFLFPWFLLLWGAFTGGTGSSFSKELPDGTWCVLYILTSKCAARHNGVHFFDIATSKSGPWGVFIFFTYTRASRHNGVHFFISHLARWLRTRRFSKPTFRPSGATNPVFRDFPTFSRICIFFLLTLSLLWSALFYSSLLSICPALLFICPYCRKFDF